ncbi:unnamed protein product [Prorocentrum cordatum]|uniref:KIF-binding protein n=1 Tax=Prorocentrum cordatum TaxID=2364126 RepID=A0ABN9TTT3_9DINO|nr:unnamed protein product [Polarella glacialis]
MTPIRKTDGPFIPDDPTLASAVDDEDERAQAFTQTVLKNAVCNAIAKGPSQESFVRGVIQGLAKEFEQIDLLDVGGVLAGLITDIQDVSRVWATAMSDEPIADVSEDAYGSISRFVKAMSSSGSSVLHFVGAVTKRTPFWSRRVEAFSNKVPFLRENLQAFRIAHGTETDDAVIDLAVLRDYCGKCVTWRLGFPAGMTNDFESLLKELICSICLNLTSDASPHLVAADRVKQVSNLAQEASLSFALDANVNAASSHVATFLGNLEAATSQENLTNACKDLLQSADPGAVVNDPTFKDNSLESVRKLLRICQNYQSGKLKKTGNPDWPFVEAAMLGLVVELATDSAGEHSPEYLLCLEKLHAAQGNSDAAIQTCINVIKAGVELGSALAAAETFSKTEGFVATAAWAEHSRVLELRVKQAKALVPKGGPYPAGLPMAYLDNIVKLVDTADALISSSGAANRDMSKAALVQVFAELQQISDGTANGKHWSEGLPKDADMKKIISHVKGVTKGVSFAAIKTKVDDVERSLGAYKKARGFMSEPADDALIHDIQKECFKARTTVTENLVAMHCDVNANDPDAMRVAVVSEMKAFRAYQGAAKDMNLTLALALKSVIANRS